MADEVMERPEGEQEVDASVELSAPAGWSKKFIRKKGKKEIVFISPTGEEIRNKRHLGQYLRSHPGEPSFSDFDWGYGDTPRRSARISQKAKATETPESEPPPKRQRSSDSKERSKQKKDDDDDADAEEHDDEAPESEKTDAETKDTSKETETPENEPPRNRQVDVDAEEHDDEVPETEVTDAKPSESIADAEMKDTSMETEASENEPPRKGQGISSSEEESKQKKDDVDTGEADIIEMEDAKADIIETKPEPDSEVKSIEDVEEANEKDTDKYSADNPVENVEEEKENFEPKELTEDITITFLPDATEEEDATEREADVEDEEANSKDTGPQNNGNEQEGFEPNEATKEEDATEGEADEETNKKDADQHSSDHHVENFEPEASIEDIAMTSLPDATEVEDETKGGAADAEDEEAIKKDADQDSSEQASFEPKWFSEDIFITSLPEATKEEEDKEANEKETDKYSSENPNATKEEEEEEEDATKGGADAEVPLDELEPIDEELIDEVMDTFFSNENHNGEQKVSSPKVLPTEP